MRGSPCPGSERIASWPLADRRAAPPRRASLTRFPPPALPPLLTEMTRFDRFRRNSSMRSRPASPCQRGGRGRRGRRLRGRRSRMLRGRRSRRLRRFAAELRSARAKRPPRSGARPRARSRAPGNGKARSQLQSGLSCSGDGWRIARPFTSACSPSTAPPSSPAPRPAAASARARGATRCRLPRLRTR